VFVIHPAFEKGICDASAVTHGALFGLVAYSTFDLTSMAVFKNWPAKITVIDLLWGTILTAGVCTLAVISCIKAYQIEL
jgi:uncharacterized membrane protein